MGCSSRLDEGLAASRIGEVFDLRRSNYGKLSLLVAGRRGSKDHEEIWSSSHLVLRLEMRKGSGPGSRAPVWSLIVRSTSTSGLACRGGTWYPTLWLPLGDSADAGLGLVTVERDRREFFQLPGIIVVVDPSRPVGGEGIFHYFIITGPLDQHPRHPTVKTADTLATTTPDAPTPSVILGRKQGTRNEDRESGMLAEPLLLYSVLVYQVATSFFADLEV